ncbi:MAG: acyl carrier protein [Pseudomonadales bacterium]
MSVESVAIEQTIETILRQFLTDSPALSRDTKLVEDLDLESVQIMEFVVEVEDHFDIAIDLESLSNVHTIGELADVVARVLG